MAAPKQISTDVLAVLSQCRVEGNLVFLPNQLDRKLYLKVNEVLEALGGSWTRKLKGHAFSDDPSDVLDHAILTGTFERPQDFGYFPTPPEIAAQLVRDADVRPGDHVLEPSAGQGALVDAILERQPALVVAVELRQDNTNVLLRRQKEEWANRHVGVVCETDFLNPGTFLTAKKGIFDCVVMNPPFSRQQDILHVLEAFTYLKKGGWLAAVMSAGVLFRQDLRTRNFRERVQANCGTITPLPEGSFKVSGTMVNTVICTMEM